MIAVRAIYDGKQVKFLEDIPVARPTNIIVTFLEDEPLPGDSEISGAEIRYLAEKGGSFDFLNDPEEDVYSDDDLVVKYNNVNDYEPIPLDYFDDLVGVISHKKDGSEKHDKYIYSRKNL